MLRPIVFAALAALLAACASTPTYTPAASANAAGYSEQQIEGNRFFVTYRAAGSADAALVQNYALLRAADVTLEYNHDWFWVDHRNVDDSPYHSGPSIGVGVGGANYGGHSGVGAGVGFEIPIGNHAAQAHSATLEIRFGEGPKPDDPNAYDAHATSANLRSQLTAPR
jgi:hypothetical protein